VKVLMVGTGAGSWTIRGEQLGLAIGARVTTSPTAADWRWASVAVLVKRAAFVHAAAAQAAGVPIVWDALDYWRQPADNHLSIEAAVSVLRQHLVTLRPALVIGATQAQADAAGGVHLPHHSRPGLAAMPVRQECHLVAYEGNEAYLGAWADRLKTACLRRGWRFAINPPALSLADIVVAFRDDRWDGYQCRAWKSGVKIVNAITAGRPIITQPSAAAREIGAPGSLVDSPEELEAALDRWSSLEMRRQAFAETRPLSAWYHLTAVAERYRAILAQARVACTA
jgi:hypothetical protein